MDCPAWKHTHTHTHLQHVDTRTHTDFKEPYFTETVYPAGLLEVWGAWIKVSVQTHSQNMKYLSQYCLVMKSTLSKPLTDRGYFTVCARTGYLHIHFPITHWLMPLLFFSVMLDVLGKKTCQSQNIVEHLPLWFSAFCSAMDPLQDSKHLLSSHLLKYWCTYAQGTLCISTRSRFG